jgi:hypothetical protein
MDDDPVLSLARENQLSRVNSSLLGRAVMETTSERHAKLRRDLGQISLDDIADRLAGISNDNRAPYEAELRRRETESAVHTAEYTRRSAKWISWSVIALIATNSLLVATQGVSMFYAMRPSVDFYTEVGTTESMAGVQLQNSGSGPAIITRISYYVDRKPVADDQEAAQYGKLDFDVIYTFQFEDGDTLAANEKQWLFARRTSNKKGLDKFTEFVDEHLGVGVMYCTVLGFPCWSKCSTKGRC